MTSGQNMDDSHSQGNAGQAQPDGAEQTGSMQTGAGSALESTSLDPSYELDAVRRHICHILGFDFVSIEVLRPDGLVRLLTFYNDETDEAHEYSLELFEDENNEILSEANSLINKEVVASQKSFVGHCQLKKRPGEESNDSKFPYLVVPISEGYQNRWIAKGLLRLISFDENRQISHDDLQTLKIVGQHLSSRLPSIALQVLQKQDKAASLDDFELKHVVLVHSNRVVRRRFSRTLSSTYRVSESDEFAKCLESLLANPADIIVVEADMTSPSAEPLYKFLKDKAESKFIPLIAITSESGANSRIDCLANGADDCIDENCVDAELLARVRSLIRVKKTERELSMQLKLMDDYTKRLEQVSEKEKEANAKITKTYAELEEKTKELRLKRYEAEMRRNQDDLLHRISNTLRASFNIEENIAQMLEELSGWAALDTCFVVLPTEGGSEAEDSIRQEYSLDPSFSLIDQDFDLRLLEIFKDNFNIQDDLFISDVARERKLDCFREDILSKLEVYSLFYLPISYEGKLQGLLGGHKCQAQQLWSTDNKNFFRQVADQLSTAVTTARLYRRVERQATTDGLTTLFNHRTGQEKLLEQLRVAERYQRNLCVIMLDVDHFKSINDTYGHPVGDTVLRKVASMIKRDCRDVDIPVRYGGEEFLIILPEVNIEGARVVAERLRKTLNREVITHENIQLTVSASLGVACFPEDSDNQQHLLELADKALYMSKRLGRNQVHIASELKFKETKEAKLESGSVQPDTQELEPQEALLQDHKQVDQAASQKNAHDDSARSQHSHVSGQQVPGPANVESGRAETGAAESMPVHIPQPRPPKAPPPPAQQAASHDDGLLVPEVVETVKKMAGALYSKSEYNKVHHLETARFAEMVAKVLGLSAKQVEQIRVASLLHDVGLLHVPDDIINKKGQVTAEELKLLMQHPTLGAEMLSSVPALREICEILEHHHECWDGTGYPQGLKGEEIPLAARIVAITEAYHAMISDRPYRPAMSSDKAKRVLKSQAGSQFDPFLVDIFLAVLSELENR